MKTNTILSFALATSTAVAIAAPASAAITMSATYFTTTLPDADFQSQCCGTFGNMIKATLGPDGLPVLNTGPGGYSGPTIHDVNGNGEITWWSAGTSRVQTPGAHTVTLPFADGSFFPPDGSGTGDGNGYLTAEFVGTLVVPVTESVTFTFGADDDAFIAVNNNVIAQLGGVHGNSPGPVTTAIMNPGNYTLRLFYADRYQTQASLNFSVDTVGVSVNPGVPEPATWAMMLVGFGGLGGLLRRRRSLVAA